MSLQTWKNAYYRETAEEAAKKGIEAAIQHGIIKWSGLRPEFLTIHGLQRGGTKIIQQGVSDGVFIVNSGSCALCALYIDANNCRQCPLSIVRGGVRCDRRDQTESTSPFHAFIVLGNPEPMIRDLKAALKNVTED